MDEFALIARHFTRTPRDPGTVLGVGDDAAILDAGADREWLATVDMMVEGRHFLAHTDPERLGHKLLAVNLSDIAAMGGRPRAALLACALPVADDAWLAHFSRGLFALADAHGVDVVGGDTTRGPRTLSVTLLGDVARGAALRRSGARAGDDIWVSGTLGDAMLALAALEGRAALSGAALAATRERLERPTPRVALGMRLVGVASAAIDISDGLCGDLAHILEQSGVGASIQRAALPRSAAMDEALAGDARDEALRCLVAGGDDYELCFTASPAQRATLASLGEAVGVRVTRIGAIDASRTLTLRDEQGAPVAPLPRAYDHFATP